MVVDPFHSLGVDREWRTWVAQHPDELGEYLWRDTPLDVVLIDKDRRIRICNPRFLDRLGLQASPVGTAVESLFAPAVPAWPWPSPGQIVAAAFTIQAPSGVTHLMSGHLVGTSTGWLILAEAHRHSYHDLVSKMSLVNNELANLARELGKKNTALAQANARIAELLRIDPLTQIANRLHFGEALQREVPRSQRHGLPLAVLMADVDHFKTINDTLGHDAGDAALVSVATAMREACRAEDVPARLGGDEFAILLPSTTATGAVALAERLRSSFAMVPLGGLAQPLTMSFGATNFRAGDSTELLMRRADEALYSAKRLGRNQVAVM